MRTLCGYGCVGRKSGVASDVVFVSCVRVEEAGLWTGACGRGRGGAQDAGGLGGPFERVIYPHAPRREPTSWYMSVRAQRS